MTTTAERLASFARDAHARGWAAATSGNFSVVVSTNPLSLLVTASGRDKRTLGFEDVVAVDAAGAPAPGAAAPSAETPIHLAVARACGAGAVAHVHTVWATVASERAAATGEVVISGIEMLKALAGVRTHEHREAIPVVENTQDWDAAAPAVESLLRSRPEAHGLLIRGHGLYTWGRDLDETWRHLEALDFLLEVATRLEAR